jgi:hypothetical protein
MVNPGDPDVGCTQFLTEPYDTGKYKSDFNCNSSLDSTGIVVQMITKGHLWIEEIKVLQPGPEMTTAAGEWFCCAKSYFLFLMTDLRVEKRSTIKYNWI